MTINLAKPLYPWFGSKRRVADVIWQRFGDVDNFVDPFMGTCSVLLTAPWPSSRMETINDLDHFVVNAWRSIQYNPEATAKAADWIVAEADLASRHYWLVTEGRKRLAEIINDPKGHDPDIAGWWLWGQCAWIGRGWCADNAGGWALDESGQWMRNAGKGVNRQLPHLGDAGQGVNRQLPHLRNAGQAHRKHLLEMFAALVERLRYVRICCGDWHRVLGPSVTTTHGTTAVILDPPYSSNRAAGCYAVDSFDVAADVREWAIKHGTNPKLRIALCGHDGEHTMPESWTVHQWSAMGGYSRAAAGETQGKKNMHLERIWFSPACSQLEQNLTLF